MCGRRLAPVALALLALPLLAGAASAQTAGLSIDVLVDQIVSVFPKVQGDVIEVQGRRVTLALGRRDGIQPGLELAVYREGRELRHPRTGEVLGRTEEPLGQATVTEVLEAYSIATAGGTAPIRSGDRVRLSSGKIRVTLFSVETGVRRSQVEAVLQALIDRMSRTGRFQVGLGDAINVWLAREGVSPAAFLEGKGLVAAAERFKLEHLLAISFKQVQKKPFMEVRLVALPAATPLLSTAMFVPSTIRPAPDRQFSSGGDRQGARRPAERKSLLARLLGGDLEAGTYSSAEGAIPLKEVARFGFPAVALDVAVPPGDRIPRLVLTDGSRIFLYRLVEGALEPVWTYHSRGFGALLSVQLADLDGDGALEVVVNRHQPARGMNSYILSTKDGKPRLLVDSVPLILLAVDADGDGLRETLWAQQYSAEKFFAPKAVARYAVKGGSLVADGPAVVPETFRATGATFANIAGKTAARVLVYVDQYQRLIVASGAEEVWRSSTMVGGGGATAEVTPEPSTRPTPSSFFKLEPLPLAVDLDDDGVEEIVVAQNQAPGLVAVVFRGPAGYRMQSLNSGFEGTITAMGAVRSPDGGQPTLIAAVVRSAGFLKSTGDTQIIMTVPQE